MILSTRGGWDGDLSANVYVCLPSEQLPRRAVVVLTLAPHRYKRIAGEAATSTVMYLLSNLCLSESPYILFREWHLSSSTLWSGASIWLGLEHAVLMDELVKASLWCCGPHWRQEASVNSNK